MSRVKSAFTWGPIVGWCALFYMILEAIVIFVSDLVYPETDIDVVKTFDSVQYNKNIKEVGDHKFHVDMKNAESESLKQSE